MKLKPWLKAVPGRASALAVHLDVTRSMVSQMANGDVPVPPRMYRAIRDFSRGEVGIEDLIPDASPVAAQCEAPQNAAGPIEDRRGTQPDRRAVQVRIGFPDQRGTKPDRRSAQCTEQGT
jgi:DNA-binding transcriptional regulator YdaS (Cro superfamily)